MDISASSDTVRQYELAFQEHVQSLYRYCYVNLRDEDLAEDVVQDVFIKTWDYISNGNDIQNVKAFLFHIAHNLVINAALKRKRRGDVSLDALMESGFEPNGGEDGEEMMRRMDEEGAVLKKLHQVPSPYRETLVLRYVENLTPREIAEITGETTNVISVHIHRGLQKLRPFLS